MCDFFLLFDFLSDSIVPRDSPAFQIYLKLRSIYLLVSSPVIPRNSIAQLRAELKEFFRLFDAVFVRRKLAKVVPKMHNLAHYPEFIEIMGPPFQYDTKRFEREHQEHKQNDASSKQFKNKPFSIIKNAILGKEAGFKLVDFKVQKLLTRSDFDCPTLAIFRDFVDFSLEISRLKFLSINKVNFQVDSIYRLIGPNPIKFVKIVFLVKQGDQFVIVGSSLRTVEFLDGIQCFRIERENSLIELSSDMLHYHLCTPIRDNLILYDSFVN